MTLPVVFTSAAEADIAEAVTWYDLRSPAAAQGLIDELRATTDRVSVRPLIFRKVHRDVRRALLTRFPYALFFRVTDRRIVVLACFHTSRDPRRLQGRV